MNTRENLVFCPLDLLSLNNRLLMVLKQLVIFYSLARKVVCHTSGPCTAPLTAISSRQSGTRPRTSSIGSLKCKLMTSFKISLINFRVNNSRLMDLCKSINCTHTFRTSMKTDVRLNPTMWR